MEKSNNEQRTYRKSLAEISTLEGDKRVRSTHQSVKFVFDPEDMKKMEGMTSMQKADYKDFLIAEGRYKKIVSDHPKKSEDE